MKKILFKNLLKFTKKSFQKIGMKDSDAKQIAYCLCETSLRGVDSHGIKLLPHYLMSAEYGRKNPRPKFEIKKKYPCLIKLNADHAFGHIAGLKAISIGTKISNKYGICAVSVTNSSHPGAMASIALRAAEKGYICICFTNADPLIRSTNSKRSFFGTNPICISVPRKEIIPYCLDMATSKISWNKLMEMKKAKKKAKEFYGSDIAGKDIKLLKNIVSLLPAGGYKGFGLASMVEILCGVYSGMEYGRKLKPMYTTPLSLKRKLSQFYIILKTDGSVRKNDFIKRMQLLTNSVRKEPKLNKKESVMLPNDPEIKKLKLRLKDGIPLSDELFTNLKNISLKYNIKLDLK